MSGADMRVGFGYDVHRLVQGRPLILGGIHFEHSSGLEGHSDADVLTHAIMDALLGAAGLGDIGQHFPNTDDRWHNASSLDLLSAVSQLVAQPGWRVVNIDATLVSEAPRISPQVLKMREALGTRLGIDATRINIKATTAEGVGPEGRRECISATAVALIVGGADYVG